MAFKLNYKIVGRRQSEGDAEPIELVDVEWRHDSGPITDYKMVPISHPPNIEYERQVDGTRDVILDCVSVRRGTPDSIVMQILEEKRAALAASLGVEP